VTKHSAARDELAPMDWMITFSSSELRRRKNPESPMARMAIGMAASIPWPTLSASYAAAIANTAQNTTPSKTGVPYVLSWTKVAQPSVDR